jgi:pimeloyl-ACP methyl ester carboxylesterase
VNSVDVSVSHHRTFRHATGRIVQCGIFGARDMRKVVFYSHGFPASRIEAFAAHQAASARGLTIIALDRPGFGGSDWYEGRQFEDWAGDVELVANELGVQRFSILGVSGGTPTAVAAAGALPERVTSLVIVSGIGPVVGGSSLRGMNLANRAFLHLGITVPALARGGVWALGQVWRTFPRAVAVWFGALLPGVDRKIVTRKEVATILARNIKEALSQGVQGTVSEFALLASDWSHLLQKVTVPTRIWHGTADTYVPFCMGEALHRRIVGSTINKVMGGGHFMILDTIDQVLDSLE